jgi:hypothetical protein
MVPGRLPSRLARHTPFVTALALLISTLIPGDASAQQYFGGNKVQYRTFTFEVLRTEHFDIYFYEEEREAAAIAARMAERWRARLGRALSHDLTGRQPPSCTPRTRTSSRPMPLVVRSARAPAG